MQRAYGASVLPAKLLQRCSLFRQPESTLFRFLFARVVAADDTKQCFWVMKLDEPPFNVKLKSQKNGRSSVSCDSMKSLLLFVSSNRISLGDHYESRKRAW